MVVTLKTQGERLEHYIKARITQFYLAIHNSLLSCLLLILNASHKPYCNREKGKKNYYGIPLVPVLPFHAICGCVRIVIKILCGS